MVWGLGLAIEPDVSRELYLSLLLTRAGAGPKPLLWSWTRSTYSHLHGVVFDGMFFAMFFWHFGRAGWGYLFFFSFFFYLQSLGGNVVICF
jgi:hypothetical protein